MLTTGNVSPAGGSFHWFVVAVRPAGCSSYYLSSNTVTVLAVVPSRDDAFRLAEELAPHLPDVDVCPASGKYARGTLVWYVHRIGVHTRSTP